MDGTETSKPLAVDMVLTDNLFRLAEFKRTIDGDTFECLLDLTPHVRPQIFLKAHIRVYNWNAAELDETDGPIMRELFDQMLKRAKRIDVQIHTMSFERIVCSVYLDKILFVGLLAEHHQKLWNARNRLAMPSIPNLPDQYVPKAGVEMNPPPPAFIEPTTHMIMDAVRNTDFGDNKHAVVTWVATTEGVNAAVVAKINDDAKIIAWIGKKWGEPVEAGIAGQIRF